MLSQLRVTLNRRTAERERIFKKLLMTQRVKDQKLEEINMQINIINLCKYIFLFK